MIGGRRAWLVLLLACTLATRLIVPAGFMPAIANGTVGLTICSGIMPAAAPAHAMPGMHHAAGHERDGADGKASMPCAFAGLGMAAIGAVPPAMLAAALGYAFLLVLRAIVRLPLPPSPRLRPPLRAPPAAI